MYLKIHWCIFAILVGILQLTQSAFFHCYRSTSVDDYEIVPYEDAGTIINKTWFNKDFCLYVYCFGLRGKHNNTETTSVLKALLALEDRNVCLWNWEEEAAVFPDIFGPAAILDYPLVVQRLYAVAYQLAQAIAKMVLAGLNLLKTHLVGHSLGGQLIGRAGTILRNQYNYIVEKITALDPAGPGFYGNSAVTISSGALVVITHTDPCGYGTSEATGHVDVYPCTVTSGFLNQKQVQPGCEITDILTGLAIGDSCSHDRAWELFIESLTMNSLQAGKVTNKLEKNEGNCSETYTMGDYINVTACGKYCLQTNGNSPFGMYEAGLRSSCPGLRSSCPVLGL